MPGSCAPGRWRAGIVRNPVGDVAMPRILAYVFGRNNPICICAPHSRTINACAKSGPANFIDPSENVCFLLGQHASTLFLVEKDNYGTSKTVAPRCHDRGSCVHLPEPGRVIDILQFRIDTAVEENQETEPGRLESFALPHPRVRVSARWIVQPIAGVIEGLV
jgi:hypothetical protein